MQGRQCCFHFASTHAHRVPVVYKSSKTPRGVDFRCHVIHTEYHENQLTGMYQMQGVHERDREPRETQTHIHMFSSGVKFETVVLHVKRRCT